MNNQWSISGVIGTRAMVQKQINDRGDISDQAKTYLAALISSIPEKFNGVKVDAISHPVGDSVHIHISIIPQAVAG